MHARTYGEGSLGYHEEIDHDQEFKIKATWIFFFIDFREEVST